MRFLFSRSNPFSSEAALVRACKKGDRLAQKTVFESYQSKMLSIILRYVKNTTEAEDLLMNGFTKVFLKIEHFREDGSFEGWIRRIMVNEALGFLRKSKGVHFDEVEILDYKGHTSHDDMPLEADELHALLCELPDGYRTVFNMYAIEGYSHKEIADTLGISENTSKSQLSRARSFLKNRIDSFYSDEKKTA